MAGACRLDEVKVYHNDASKLGLSTVIQGLRGGCFSIHAGSKEEEFSFSTGKDDFFTYKESKQ